MIEVTEDELRKLKGPNQIMGEWKTYLQFLQGYCKAHKIEHPVVVEIGTQYGRQKAHYEKFLDAVHIGIDIDETKSKPDILGDSHSPVTMAKLGALLNGRAINFLFIDGMHTYADAVADYWAYGQVTQNVVAFHDIRHEKEIGRLWKDLQELGKQDKALQFYTIGGWGNGWCELGIGLIVKQNRDAVIGV
jgi:hypothetical protein